MKFHYLSLVLLIALALVGVVPLAAQDGIFPVTVEHKFGSTTIPEQPQRVVAIGFTEQDYLLAVGVIPVAVRSWYSDETIAFLPWAVDEANGATPEILVMPFGNLNYEAILALQPDLISAVTAGLTQEEYDLLSQIAPTVAQSGDYVDFGMPWQEIQRSVGRAVGRADEAEVVVSEVEALIATVHEQHPEFEGQTIAVAYNYGNARTYGYYTSQDGRGRFFTDLGFVIPQELDDIAGEQFYADISAERIDLLDQDVLVFLGLTWAEGGQEAIINDPLIRQLGVAQRDRIVFIPAEYDDALQYSSPLSMAFALENIVPLLAQAFDSRGMAASQTMCETGFRPFAHAMGETCIPADPQRVVVLDTGELDNALALGANIVGAPVNDAMLYQEYLIGQLDGIADIGAIGTPNLEAILATAPDLIIGSKQRYEEIYDQLSQIAPTVMTESLRVPWQDNFVLHADALNRTAEAEALLMQYDAQTAALREALGDALDTTTISVIRFRPGQVRLYLKSSYIGYILQDIGLPRPASQDEDTFSLEISLEDVRAVDAEYIFITGYNQDDSDLQTFLESPLWQTLSAVQNERAIDVNDDTWIAGLGVQSAFAVLDDLAQILGAAIPPSPFANS